MSEARSYIPAKVYLSYLTIAALVFSVGWLIFNENNRYATAESLLAKENTKALKVGNLLSHIYKTENLSRIAIQTASEKDFQNYVSETMLVNAEIDSLKMLASNLKQDAMMDSVKMLLSRKTANIQALRQIKEKAVDETALNRAISHITVMEDSLRKLRVNDFVRDPEELQDYQKRVLTRYIDYLNQNIPNDETNTLSQRALDSMLLVSRALLKDVSSNLEKRRAALNSEERKLLENELAISEQLQRVLGVIERDIFINTANSNAEKEEMMQRTNDILTIAAITGLFLTAFFVILISSDFSKTQTYKRKLEAAQLRLAALLKNREQLISTVSHDLKTPLSTIVGYSSLLDKTPLDPKQRHYNQNIGNSSEYISKLVQDLLDFTKIEAGKITVEHIPFSLPTVLSEVCEGLQAMYQNKDIELTISSDPAFGNRIVGDPFRLRQILTNLIGNAYKFTDRGFIRILAVSSAEHYSVSVEDSGIGISEKDQKAVFDEFTQANEHIEKRYGGSGLGLTISRMMSEILGGSLSLKSVPGAGSTFTLNLPLKFADDDKLFSTSLKKDSSLAVVVIDDDVDLLQLTAEILKNEGHIVTLFHSASDAKAKVSAVSYDVLITDIQMPVLDGFEFIKYLREDPSSNYQQQPVIAVTGNADLQLAAYEAAGFSTVLRKPFRPKHLLEVLRSVGTGANPMSAYPPAEMREGDEEMYNLADLRQILNDDSEAIGGILNSLASSSAANLEALEFAIRQMDLKAVGELVHKMTPMFRQIYAGKVLMYLGAIGGEQNQVALGESYRALTGEITSLFADLKEKSII